MTMVFRFWIFVSVLWSLIYLFIAINIWYGPALFFIGVGSLAIWWYVYWMIWRGKPISIIGKAMNKDGR